MSRQGRRLALTCWLMFALCSSTFAQFGKNKITYQDFDWHVYRSPHFDVHYYPALEPFVEEIVSFAESAYLSISQQLDHEVTVRIPLVVYKTQGEFQQTNITLSEVPSGVAAFAEPVQYRMVLPIDHPPDELYKLIAHELVHIFEYSMFFGGNLGRTLRSNPPTWLMEGLASYLADDENNLDRMAIRDAVVNNILPPVQALNQVTFLTYRYGHAIFDYIEQEHGIEGLRSFLFEFKKVLVTGQIGRAIKESFGYDIEEFNRRFNRYLRKKYFPVLLEKKSPDDYGEEVGIRKRGSFTFSPTISPSGELIAALGTPRMELDLLVLSAEDGKKVKNVTKGWTNRYRTLSTGVFEGKRDVSWSPTADRIAVFAERENRWPLLIYNALNGKLVDDIVIPDIYELASPAYSPDGQRVAFEGNRNGVVDIFELDLATRELRNLTEDDFFDTNPWYSADGKTLLYNRRIGEHWKIFSVDLGDPDRKTQITFGQSSDLQPSYSRDERSIFFSSDRGPHGVFNIHELDLESGDIRQHTDVVGGCLAPQELAEREGERYLVFQAYFEGTFRLYRMRLQEAEREIAAVERISEAEAADAEPFEPALNLRVDEAQKSKYKLKWDVEIPSFAVGVADDGTFLANGAVQFTDLLGDHRVLIGANTVADFASFNATYANFKNRYTWGGTLYDYRDFIYLSAAGQIDRQTESKATGANVFFDYPLNRYYRVSTSVGALDSSRIVSVVPTPGDFDFQRVSDQFGTLSVSLIGDTTRYQGFGPFQGKRLNLGVRYWPQITGDSPGDVLEYRFEYRGYKQLTRRSLLAWRVATIYNDGDSESIYGFGGLNQLRGWDFREFNGSRLAWSNLELRFPLIDELRLPVISLVQIRGFFFLDVGATWLLDDRFYDPELLGVRVDNQFQAVPFEFWDSENDRLQDGRASYGFGVQFRFLGGLQFNWAWAKRLDFSQWDPASEEFVRAPRQGTRTEFYIAFDF